MGNFETIVNQKFQSNWGMRHFYRLFTNYQEVDNAEGVVQNKNCYKILCFDDQDDVFDTFCSLHHSIASKLSREKYDSLKWRQFYFSLQLLFELEKDLHDKEIDFELSSSGAPIGQKKTSVVQSGKTSQLISMLRSIDLAVEEMNQLQHQGPSTPEIQEVRTKNFSVKSMKIDDEQKENLIDNDTMVYPFQKDYETLR